MHLSTPFVAALPQGHPAFPNFHVELPHTMPEFGAQRGGPGPASANTHRRQLPRHVGQHDLSSPHPYVHEHT